MSRKSLIEFDHAQLPDPVDAQQVHDWARNMLSFLVGGNANDLPMGAHLKHIRVGDEPCPIDHHKHGQDDVASRIRAYLNRS